MQSNLKLAIGLGVFSSFMPFICFLACLITFRTELGKSADADLFTTIMLLDCVFAAAIPFCSYFYAVENNKIAFGVIIISSIFTLLISGFFGLFLIVWATPFALMLLISLPLTLITILLTVAAGNDYRITKH